MASPIGSMNNVKIFVLYLMRNINYPLDLVTVNDIVMQTDYIMYLDFAEAFHDMLDNGLIEEVGKNEAGEPLYSVTSRGAIVAEQLKSDLLPSILDHSLTCALRYLDFKRRGVRVKRYTMKFSTARTRGFIGKPTARAESRAARRTARRSSCGSQ